MKSVLFTVLIGAAVSCSAAGPPSAGAEKDPVMQTNENAGDFTVPREWLDSLVTLDEIEGPARAPDLIKPADGPAWRAFKDKFRPGDELWYFTSPPGFFGRSAGRMGYAIMRDGKQVASFTALMN